MNNTHWATVASAPRGLLARPDPASCTVYFILTGYFFVWILYNVRKIKALRWLELCLLLRKVLEQREAVYEKISQYLQLKNTIQSLQVFFSSCATSPPLAFRSETIITHPLYFVYCKLKQEQEVMPLCSAGIRLPAAEDGCRSGL